MIQNTAFLASLTVFLAVGWGAGELRFLAPYKAGARGHPVSRVCARGWSSLDLQIGVLSVQE